LVLSQRRTMSSQRCVAHVHKLLQCALILVDSKLLYFSKKPRTIRVRLNASKSSEDGDPVSESRRKQLLDVRYLLSNKCRLFPIVDVISKVNKCYKTNYDLKQFDEKRKLLGMIWCVLDLSLHYGDRKRELLITSLLG